MFGGTQSLLFSTTSKDGHFELVGCGVERLVRLRITGPGIAQTYAEIITRAAFDPEPFNALTRCLSERTESGCRGRTNRRCCWARNPTVVAGAEQVVRGVVVEAETGKPRPGVRVAMDRNSQGHRLEATTDTKRSVRDPRRVQGHKLHGHGGIRPGNWYAPATVTVPDSGRYEPLTADITTARGVVITGRVTDRATGKPVPARVWVGGLFDNPHAKKPEYDSFDLYHEEASGPDGTFRIVAIPGRVLLMAGPDSARLPGGFLESLSYRLPTADSRVSQLFPGGRSFFCPTG